jgi:SAM-dependent methyltransferase
MSMCQSLIHPLYLLSEQSRFLRGGRVRPVMLSVMQRLSRHDAKAARRAFEAAADGPSYLPIAQLPALIARYAKSPKRWDKRKPADKAAGRAIEVLKTVRRHLPTNLSAVQAVELACGDGRVAMHLARSLGRVTGTDLSDHFFADEARKLVPIRLEDAATLSFADASIDLLYTFDAFEHFDNPAAVLAEAHRVLKPGGVLYASFGPLWNSAFGPHQWGRIDVPYVHHLFDADALDAYADAHDRRRLTRLINRLPLAYFRNLFHARDERFNRVHYVEKLNVSSADLIIEHPSCFQAKVDSFDELCVRSIEVVIKKMS